MSWLRSGDEIAEFLNRSIELQQIGDAIDTWATWHWLRTGLAIGALIFASWGLLFAPDRGNSIELDRITTN